MLKMQLIAISLPRTARNYRESQQRGQFKTARTQKDFDDGLRRANLATDEVG